MIDDTSLKNLVLVINELKLRCRAKSQCDSHVSEWAEWVGSPSESYIELAVTGPLEKSEVNYIEINPIKETRMGRLIPIKKEDLKDQCMASLTAHSIPFKESNGLIRIDFAVFDSRTDFKTQN